MNKNRKWVIELTEEQMMHIADCVEDVNRFVAGDCEMYHATCMLDHRHEIVEKLKDLHPLVTPELPRNANYGWSGGSCPNTYQRKFIAKGYAIYREILHQYVLANGIDNVYSSETLTCEDGGELPKVYVKE